MPHEPDSTSQPVIVLVHSPLVGPLSWAPVSQELRKHGVGTLLPVLDDHGNDAMPFWVQHATAIAQNLESLPPDGGVILVGHSGAGPLLPAIGAFSPHPVAGYLFVDAGLPHPGRSLLDEIEAGMPEFGRELRHELEAGGTFPQSPDEDLRDLIPDAGLRQGVLAELQPGNLTFFEEQLPHVDRWPNAPCAYIRLSEGYDRAGQEAQRRGWSYREFDAGHFHMLVDAAGVAEAILQLAPLEDARTTVGRDSERADGDVHDWGAESRRDGPRRRPGAGCSRTACHHLRMSTGGMGTGAQRDAARPRG